MPGAGRKKGSMNKIKKQSYEKIERLEKNLEKLGKRLPLEYMLDVMNDNTVEVDRRDRMAVAAGPYCHNRLSSVTMRTDPNAPITVVTGTMTPKEAAAAYAAMLKEEK